MGRAGGPVGMSVSLIKVRRPICDCRELQNAWHCTRSRLKGERMKRPWRHCKRRTFAPATPRRAPGPFQPPQPTPHLQPRPAALCRQQHGGIGVAAAAAIPRHSGSPAAGMRPRASSPTLPARAARGPERQRECRRGDRVHGALRFAPMVLPPPAAAAPAACQPVHRHCRRRALIQLLHCLPPAARVRRPRPPPLPAVSCTACACWSGCRWWRRRSRSGSRSTGTGSRCANAAAGCV